MAAISSLGVGSGLDLGALVTGLLDAERVPAENRLALKQQNISAELSGFGLMRSSLSQFQSSLGGLQSAESFNAKSVSVSDTSVFTATAENDVELGSYSVEVSKLATSQSLATSALTPFSALDDVIGSGTLSFQFGTTTTGPYGFTADLSRSAQTIDVSVANGNNTLSGLRDYINSEITDIQASIVNDGSGYRLVLTSENTGADNSLEITVTNDGDLDNNDNSGLSQLAFNALAQSSLTQTVAAQDAELSINGLDVTSASNNIDSVLDGVTLNLKKADAGNFVNLAVTKNLASITASINGFVEAFNELRTNIDSLTSFNADTGTGSVLIGDFTVRSISSQLRNVIFGSVSGLSGEIRSLVDIGVTTNSSGTLEVDSASLSEALDNYPSQVAALFGLQGTTTDPGIDFVASTSDTQSGEYAINVTQIFTQGYYTGTGPVNSLTVNNGNNRIGFTIDGVSTGNFNLTGGTYTDEAAFAAMMEGRINGRANLVMAGITVSVTYDATDNRYVITSDSSGPSSSVEVTRVDPNTFADFGISVDTGIDGTDTGREVTIDGSVATANGQIYTSESGSSNGLSIELLTNAPGNRGSVTLSEGLVGRLDGLLDNFLQSNGTIASREQGLNDDLDEIEDERFKLEDRLLTLEARLIRQFSALDILVAQFNQTSSFLTQQLANLPKPNSGGNNN